VAEKVRVAVVIRIDSFAIAEDSVTVVSVFFDLEVARAEAQRLNELNSAKGLRYFAQVSRLYPDGRGKLDDEAGA
jgi:pyruvate/2-oxoacid:ferredoxin oxidoreductase alpha subunit